MCHRPRYQVPAWMDWFALRHARLYDLLADLCGVRVFPPAGAVPIGFPENCVQSPGPSSTSAMEETLTPAVVGRKIHMRTC